MTEQTDGPMIAVMGCPDPDGLLAAKRLQESQVIGSAILYESVDSTNTAALAEIKSQCEHLGSLPRLLVADRQVSGRGRHGRRWDSDGGTLTFTLVISNEDPEHREAMGRYCSLAVGVGISRFLEYEFSPLKTSVKWPNDVYLAGGKLAGILLELDGRHPEYLVIGVGMNIGSVPELTDTNARQSATGLTQVIGRKVERYHLLDGLVESILEAVDEISDDPIALVRELRDRCLLTGEKIEYQQDGSMYSGLCLGISEGGGLRIASTDGEIEITSGEAMRVRRHNDNP
ncbi:MAG: biotin--[acetyl-CoA-carboxylase] ligase [Rubripirellula sp.]|nr:biotin--[acetyl-CoA-carboxylase] ligase [Rubripirellula sp.]